MKKFFAMLLTFCLSFCMLSATVQASDDVTLLNSHFSVVENSIGVAPRAVTYLKQIYSQWFIDYYSVQVTPAKGTNLKIIINATDNCKIEVTKNGGWWPSKTVTYEYGSGTQTIDLINNCNGEPYTIKFTNNTGVTFTAFIVQTEYI